MRSHHTNRHPGRSRRAPIALAAPLVATALLVLFGLGSIARAESPTPDLASPLPSAASTPAASIAPASSGPGGSAAPCPNPTAPPTPTPLPSGVSPSPTGPGATPEPTRHPNLCPAEPAGGNPTALIAWIFTPIFQTLFLGLALAYKVTGDIGIAIVLLTIAIRILLVPIFRKQIVSQRRMQMVQPEIKAIQQRFKGNRAKVSEETMRLYKERGVNPASGCLPGVLQLVLLIPMYSVFSGGLLAPDISSMLSVFGQKVLDIQCVSPGNPLIPCINPTVHWLNNLDASVPSIQLHLPVIGFGISLLAVLSAMLQVVQTRMMTPRTDDPQAATQQRIFLVLPLISVVYGQFLPAGLFIYWIVTTIFSIVQQYLIAGWGGLFPLFGWTPAFVASHQPRFPVPPPVARPRTGAGDVESSLPRRTPAEKAQGTVRPAKDRGRTSRRGRRR